MVRKTMLLLCMGTALVMLTACGGNEEAEENVDAAAQDNATAITETTNAKTEEAVEATEDKTDYAADMAEADADAAIETAEDKATEIMTGVKEEATDTKLDVKKQIEGC